MHDSHDFTAFRTARTAPKGTDAAFEMAKTLAQAGWNTPSRSTRAGRETFQARIRSRQTNERQPTEARSHYRTVSL